MGARLFMVAENKRQHWVTGMVVAIILVAAIIGLSVEYLFNGNGTGFAGKTLWDWLQLLAALAIPVVVGFGAVWFTTRQGKVADSENTDNQRETALQTYIDKMSELLLHEKLRDSAEEYEVRSIAQVRTFTILNRLDAERKASVLIFLSGAGLIKKNKSIIDMMGANLSGAYLGPIFGGFTYELGGENLRGAYLFRANLSKSYLSEANLSYANLVEVNFD